MIKDANSIYFKTQLYSSKMQFFQTSNRTFCSKSPKIHTIKKDEEGKESLSIDIGKMEGNYAIVYTWTVWETRQARSFSKKSYHEGVVLIRCEGCDNLHLIADNLGWFRDKSVNIEDLMREKGDKLRKIISNQAMEFLDEESKEGLKIFLEESEKEKNKEEGKPMDEKYLQ